MKKSTINPETLFDSIKYGFSQVVVSDPGKMVFISGQVAWNREEQIIGANDLELQTIKSVENLETSIGAAGGTLGDIVMLRIYKVNYQEGDGVVIGRVLKDKFGAHLPASTWIGVQKLAGPDFLIEIEAQAVI